MSNQPEHEIPLAELEASQQVIDLSSDEQFEQVVGGGGIIARLFRQPSLESEYSSTTSPSSMTLSGPSPSSSSSPRTPIAGRLPQVIRDSLPVLKRSFSAPR
jgi:hypothetical protein